MDLVRILLCVLVAGVIAFSTGFLVFSSWGTAGPAVSLLFGMVLGSLAYLIGKEWNWRVKQRAWSKLRDQ